MAKAGHYSYLHRILAGYAQHSLVFRRTARPAYP